MASKTSKADPLLLADFAADIARRRAAYAARRGTPCDLPRTPSKRALLKAIEDEGGKG